MTTKVPNELSTQWELLQSSSDTRRYALAQQEHSNAVQISDSEDAHCESQNAKYKARGPIVS